MRAILRPAHPEDFDYCARLYFAGMENIIKELNQNMDAQIAGLRQRWDVTQVRMVTFNSADIGWVQSFVQDNALFLAQLFVDGQFQRRGIGTDVVKANPALRLYERLGFRITHDDDRKFYMRRDCGV